MTPENINTIKDALAPVADKIGQGAEYGWETLVMGQFAEGVAMLIICTLMFICAAILARVSYKMYQTYEEYDMPTFAFLLIPIVFLILFGFIEAYEALIQVIAPEYAALKFLISLGR